MTSAEMQEMADRFEVGEDVVRWPYIYVFRRWAKNAEYLGGMD